MAFRRKTAMRFGLLPCAAAILLLTVGATAAGQSREVRLPLDGKARACTSLSENGGEVPQIKRGQKIDIACSAASSKGARVRVVMQFDGMPGESDTGYNAFLITEQTVAEGLVQVRVPDMPEVANHTVDVKVYVTDQNGTSSCDAGRIKIV